MKKHLTKLVAVVVIAIMGLSFVASAQFPDVPADHWAYDAVTRLVDEGLLNGMPDGNFHGNESMNRYAVAVLVSRLLDRDGTGSPAAVTEKTVVERVVQEPVEVTKVVEKEYIEKPVQTIIEKHIVHELAGLEEVNEKLAAIEKRIEDREAKDAELFQYTNDKIKSLQDENAANASQIKKLDESVSEMKAKVDEVSNGASVKTVNEIKSQLDAQNDKLIKMEKQLKSTRTIAIMGLIAGITGIVLAFVIK